MANYGTNMGKGNNYNGPTNVKNNPKIDKSKKRTTISVSIGVIVVVAVILIVTRSGSQKTNITGRWITSDGETVEFLSDGTIHQNGYDSLYPDTYEIMEEGYLKWGQYDAGWIEYRYTYWDVNIEGNHLTLTMRNNPDYVIELTK